MKQLRVIPLGGLGEIGKNMTVFEYGDDAIILDTGIMFPEGDHLGVDYIIPDMGYLFEHQNRLKIHGIFITHGHEDHTGAIHHVLEHFDAPVYGTALTCGLIEVKLKQAKMRSVKINVFRAGDTIKAGPFELESFHVCHSIPDGVGFGIRTPVGLIVHTGDFKFDHTPVDNWPPDFARLAAFAKEGVLALLADSTNADRPGWTPSESVIDEAFDRVFRNAQGRILIATFASLISRVEQAGAACLRYGRKMAILGHSMSENIKMAQELGYIDFPDDLIVSLDKALQMDKNKIAFMVTGSQGEPSAVLSKLATKRHSQLEIEPGDTVVVSAHAIPGNENTVSRIINKLFQRGAKVIYDAVEKVHVSGHASQEEMKLMINLVKPKFFVPVHGELRHLHQHAELAISLGIPESNCVVVENGTILEFTKNKMTVGERYPGGYVFVDGAGVGDIGPAVIRDREILANEGFVTVIAQINKKGELATDPHVISRGFVFIKEAEEIIDGIKDTVRKALSKSRNGRRQDVVTDAITKYLYQETKRRPMVFAYIIEI
ncbi:MAG: ribonuclease J [Anaerolineae bacterium]|nr:ribonuclease J [Anaerolineae bacterium]